MGAEVKFGDWLWLFWVLLAGVSWFLCDLVELVGIDSLCLISLAWLQLILWSGLLVSDIRPSGFIILAHFRSRQPRK